MSPAARILLAAFALTAPARATPAVATQASAAWVPDLGNGTYRNPILFADYSDPDAIRVGSDFYLVSSSFHATPGLPILHSKDLVNWTLINHALAVQVPEAHFAKVRHGEGVWAPAIRFHEGRFWIAYPDPDFGIYLMAATDPAGAWSKPLLVLPGRGLIDPCPFWDDDGRLYLIHAWAKSRAGVGNRLGLVELSADATHPIGPDRVIIDADDIPGWNTLEGPKLYKRHGYYYVFAPAGGVAQGYQTVFRSRSLAGPYEHRIVLEQGGTPINGPHQGAWVDTPSGQDWFLHFQDRGPFGRVVHLEPMAWRDDWPVMGTAVDGPGPGHPVLVHAKPDVGRAWPAAEPQTSDDFDSPALGLQWQWNANPRPGWLSLVARPGFLRLYAQPAPARRNDGSPASGNLYDVPNFLLQKFPAPAFTVTTSLTFSPKAPGETAGLAVFGYAYALLGLQSTPAGQKLVLIVNHHANRPGSSQHEDAGIGFASGNVFLRVAVDSHAVCRFAYSLDGRTFLPIGHPFQARVDRWVGARFGLLSTAPSSASSTGYADFDWLRVAAIP